MKVPVASEMARCAPPYTVRAEKEPCKGGAERANFLTMMRNRLQCRWLREKSAPPVSDLKSIQLHRNAPEARGSTFNGGSVEVLIVFFA